MSESYISTHFVHIPPLGIFLVEGCRMETSINLLGILGNSYIASFTECFLIMSCDLQKKPAASVLRRIF